jgi:glycerophosphoryl diester phosphodiesterase
MAPFDPRQAPAPRPPEDPPPPAPVRRPEAVAHRGFSAAAPENTLPAFRAAMDVGADRVEFDVLLSADGVPVVIHDDKLDRTTSGTGLVAERRLEEIRALDAGAWFGERFRGVRVPTLDEVLDLCRGKIAVNVEIKTECVAPGPAAPPGGVEAKVVEALRRRGMAARAAISSFDPRPLSRIRTLAPELALQSLYDGKRMKGLGPREVCAEVGSRALNCSLKEATAAWIAEAHGAGLLVNVYTVDERRDMERLIGMGADGIITDRPDLLLEVLRRQPVPAPPPSPDKSA